MNAARVAAALVLALMVSVLRAEWQRTDTSLAWAQDGKVVWQFSFDPGKGKPFFHPVSVKGGTSLTNFKPEDHPWHYGLWFSWKYINGVNYWEENRQTGRAQGATRWSPPQIETRADGSAIVRMDLTYAHPSGRADLTEKRELTISAPNPDGSYTIDWRSDFTAGEEGAELARTPMPGEPDGRFNGGYAGLSVRLASAPAQVAFVTTDGAIETFTQNRARPFVPAVAANVTEGGKDVGAIAILSARENTEGEAPWYLVQSDMRFACAAILAPKVVKLPAGGKWNLSYRLAIRAKAWTPAALKQAMARWSK